MVAALQRRCVAHEEPNVTRTRSPPMRPAPLRRGSWRAVVQRARPPCPRRTAHAASKRHCWRQGCGSKRRAGQAQVHFVRAAR
eukprot:scaffold9267_cov112-Isochrysis_galbana.AAC.3